MTVDIYTETTWKGPRRQTGILAYIIVVRYEGHEDYTDKRMVRLKNAGMQEAELLAAAMAIDKASRMPRLAGCRQYNVISSNHWVENMSKSIPKWQENGWKNAKGEDVKYSDWWQTIAKVQKDRTINWTSEHEPGSGLDGYQRWLREQIERA